MPFLGQVYRTDPMVWPGKQTRALGNIFPKAEGLLMETQGYGPTVFVWTHPHALTCDLELPGFFHFDIMR